ncbi:papain family cysteine protease subfamily protein [Acanthamoeba castellanii str. Neff]|uniref:Papain family cysteine protease subfamily protein n=1 Tax=Acanthamoeba castellanii (strain ATCC 30010 / Neff) TaxID=1257118 RepID=L8H305_ACACF|nr:papain family cysteine protease subfamily protein [Acanthamoeba castellanii str. Neff]ELR19607.1 papain family cysteine protease subfamily protein [Acanthamoeba castellanii str. Neff]
MKMNKMTTTAMLMAAACVVLCLATLGSAISPRFDERGYTLLADTHAARSEFNAWARQNGRSYAAQEFGYRYNVWRDNAAYVEHFNANANASFTVGLNDLADMTLDEVARVYTGLAPAANPFTDASSPAAPVVDDETELERVARQLPASYDWRNAGAVTPVKNQGSCGACYTFSANAAIEGMYKIAAGQLTSLSEQMLLDCAQGTGNLGCNGGNMEITYSWILNNGGGVNTLASYPWSGFRSTCRYSASNNGAVIKAYRRATSGSEAGLLTLASRGPVSVGINASPRSFTYYRSGTLIDSSCTAAGMNHAVTVVGWGTDASGNPYWLIKNSWGTSWGLSGYAQIGRNSGNMCGIATMASQPCFKADCSQ